MTSVKRKRGEILHRLHVDTAVSKTMRSQIHATTPVSDEPFMGSAFRGDSMLDAGLYRACPDAVCFLEFGMVVSLMANDRSGVIASEGFTACEVRLERTLSTALFDDPKQESQLVACHFKDCLFEVLPKMSYDATLAYDKATAQLGKKDGLSLEGFSNPLSEMRFKSESEKRLNATAYSKCHGKHVNYGQGIQLRHVKSGKFLSTKPSSYDTSDSLDICLTSGSTTSHFVLLPRFKLRRKGEPVQIQDQIVLATDDSRLFVQTSTRFDNALAPLLTASVAHSMQWRLLAYDLSDAVHSSAEKYRQDDSQGFKAGQCLRMCHLETGSWLAYDSTSATLRLDGCDASEGGAGAALSPDTLWEVERSRVYEGGAIHWTKHVCLRHVTSGKYLALASHPVDHRVTAVAQRTPHTFALRPMTHVNLRAAVAHDSVVQVQHVESGAFLHAASTPHLLHLAEEAATVLSCPVECVASANDEDAFKLVSVPQTEVHDIMLLSSYRRMLKRFVHFFESKANAAATPPSFPISTESFLQDVLAALDAMKAFAFQDTTHDHRRQVLLRKHQYIELVTRMLEAPFEPWGGPFSMAYVSMFRAESRPTYDPMKSNISMTLDGLDDGSDDSDVMPAQHPPPPGPFALSEACMKTIYQIVRAANVLLFRMFSTCKHSDASSCGRSLSVLMKMLGHGFKASFPLSYLIQEKFHLSGEFKSFSKIIRDFLDLIKAQGKSYRYVQFLVVLCTANGLAVPKIQEKICDLIFVPSEGYRDDILLATRPTQTNSFEVCIPTRRGIEWKALKDFYDEYYKSNLHTTLAPYFYGLLQLYVALCTDRNYKCIEILKDKFPRKCLLACVQDVKLARSIRAVLMNLLLVVHIDCDPQKPVASPNYTRIWKDAAIEVPQVDTTKYSLEDRDFFDQMKDLLMDYIARRKGVIVVGVGELARNELTLAMMRTCQKLVDFGMFHRDLQELVGHLVDLLDCRTDSIVVPPDAAPDAVEYSVPFFENSVQRNKNPFSRQYSHTHDAKLPLKPVKRLSIGAGAFAKPRNPATQEGTTVSRFKASEGNTIVMEIKDCICATLLRVDALRLDYQLSLVLTYIKDRNRSPTAMADNVSPLAQALAQRKYNLTCEYSLQVLANRRLDTILLQTLMYEHPPLVSKALELLYLQFNQHEQLIKALGQVFLLVNDTTVHLYAKLQDDVDRLRHLAETTEVWMDLTSSGDFDAAARACALLKSLKALMQSKEGVAMTRLIANLEVLQYVVAMIYSGSHYFHELFPSKTAVASPQKSAANSSSSGTLVHDVLQDQQRSAIRSVYDCCMDFLVEYCQLNVQSVAEYAATLLDFVEELPSAQDALLAIYSNDLCDAIPHEVLLQFVRWSILFKPAKDARFLAFLTGVAVTSHTQRALLMQLVRNPQVVETQDAPGRAYVAAILDLLTAIATTNQARDICTESFVSVARWVDLMEQFKVDPAAASASADKESFAAFGFAAIKYLKDVLLQHDDCVYKMDDALHVRLFDVVREFSLFCIRRHVLALAQVDLRDDKTPVVLSNDVPMIKHLIPALVAYFPKLNTTLVTSVAAIHEWLAAWYVWVFCAVSAPTLKDAAVESALHLCIRWLDQLWRPTGDASSLEELFVEGCRRSARPFLGIGLSGMRTSEPFVLDLDKKFADLLGDVQAYRVYCVAKAASASQLASSAAPPAQAIEAPIPPLDKLPALHVDVVRKQSWLPPWGGSAKKRNAAAVLPANSSPKSKRTASPRAFNLPNFGAYSEDDSSIVHDFMKYVRDHRQTKSAIRNELSAMMQSILCLEDALKEENVTNSGVPAVISTFDEVAAKLVSHFKMLKQAKYVKMSLVLLDVFTRTILSLESDRKRRKMQLKLDQLGLTDVIVDLISHSEDFHVFDRCVWLGIAMLDGMNARVQEKFHALIARDTDFLAKFKLHFDMLTNAHTDKKPGLVLRQMMYFAPKTRNDLAEPTSKYQSAARQFRFLQLLCEGHYLLNQHCMLGVHGGVNIVDATTLVVAEFHTNVSWDAMALLRQVFDTLTEFCQGPCPEAQMCVANYKFMTAVNELLWRDTKTLTVTALDLLRQLKASIVIALLSLLERRVDHEIHRRMVQELNLEAIKANLIVVHDYFLKKYEGKYDGNEACSRDAFLTMGFNIHILMQQLMEFQPSLVRTLYPTDADNRELAYRRAYDFFDDRCARVEILWPRVSPDAASSSAPPANTGDLMSIYFPLHPICVCLTDRTKRRLIYDVSRDANKLNDFYDKTHLVILEMQHQCTLRGHAWMAFLTLHLSQLKMAAFVWSLFLNGLIVLYNQLDPATPPPFAVTLVGYAHVALCLAMVAGHCINDVPLLLHAPMLSAARAPKHLPQHNGVDNSTLRFDSTVKETFQDVEAKVREIGDHRLRRAYYRHKGGVVWFVLTVVLWDAKTMYYLVLLALAIGGAVLDAPLLFSFHVLDIVNRSSELRYISKAIVYPGKSLLHILYLYFLSTYIFGFVGVTYFSAYFEKDGYNGCETLWGCFLTSLDQGFKSDGGLGGFLTPSHRNAGDPLAYPRFVYDLLYYVGLIVILTNLAFGLIIDTFATLRTQHKEKQDDLKDRCFICSIDCYTFNRMTKGFDHHTRHEHNIWHYIYLFVHLRKKKFTEYNGVELYLATRMAKRDVTFFPSHRALALEKQHGDGGLAHATPTPWSATEWAPPPTALRRTASIGPLRRSMPHPSPDFGTMKPTNTTTPGSLGEGAASHAIGPPASTTNALVSTQEQLTEMYHDLHAQQQDLLAMLQQVVASSAATASSPSRRAHPRKAHRLAKSTSPVSSHRRLKRDE